MLAIAWRAAPFRRATSTSVRSAAHSRSAILTAAGIPTAAASVAAASPPASVRHSGWRPWSTLEMAPPGPPGRPRQRSAAGAWHRWSAAAPAPLSEHATRASLRYAAASAPTAQRRRSPGRAWPPPISGVARSRHRRRIHSPVRARQRDRARRIRSSAVSSTSSHTPPRNGECSRSSRTLHSLKPSTGSIRSGSGPARTSGALIGPAPARAPATPRLLGRLPARDLLRPGGNPDRPGGTPDRLDRDPPGWARQTRANTADGRDSTSQSRHRWPPVVNGHVW